MGNRFIGAILVLFCCMLSPISQAAAADKAKQVDFIQKVQEIPFSFVYSGKSSHEFISKWKKTESKKVLPNGVQRKILSYTDPQSQLEVTCEISQYPKSHAAEWLLRLKNNGSQDTAILEDIRPLDLNVPEASGGTIIFHSAYGSPYSDSEDFTPIEKPLHVGSDIRTSHYYFQRNEHSYSYLPFFNLQWENGGVIGAIGWTGQWVLEAQRSENGVRILSGQETNHFKLHAGEEVRTPRILLLQWEGKDRFVGHNALRQLLLAHYVPRVHGEIALPPVAHSGAYVCIFDDVAKKTGEDPLKILPNLRPSDLEKRFVSPDASLNCVTEQNQLLLINGMPDVGVEAYWLDAGWFEGLWPHGRGSWVPNKNFPNGMRLLGDATQARKMKFLLWFDPEAVSPGSIIAKEHPEWVLHQPNEGPWGGIFRFSDPKALAWMTNLMAKCIADWRVDIYRNDRNTNPLPFWQAADAPDRQGITEIRQIEGFYAFWDGLLTRFPELTIDNANWRVTGPDLEVMKRSVGSLTRTEIAGPGIPYPIPEQMGIQELSLWIPLHATLLHAASPYDFRSTSTTGVAIGLDLQSPYVASSEIKKGIAEIKEQRPYWLGDFYPLTEINTDETAWAGWQLNRNDLNGGFVTMFRRSRSTESERQVTLHGIDAHAQYEVTMAESFDPGPKQTMSGAELEHLKVSLASPQSSVLIRYKKIGVN
jgi:alpha-galactosidase